MRIVIYDEYMEPLTVVSIPGLTDRDIEAHGRNYLLPVPEPMSLKYEEFGDQATLTQMKVVQLSFEQIVRKGQRAWMVFTKQDEWAMLLDSCLLPGQRRDHDDLRAVNAALSDALIKGIFRDLHRG